MIVDDEPLARKILEDYITLLPNLSLIASCKSAAEAIDSVHKSKIDILFCDIKMPGIDGLQLMKILQPTPKIIITSAHSEFAIEGFNIGVVDYLLKPISLERFLLAVNRAMGNKAIEVNSLKREGDDFMFFKTGNTNERVFIKNIDFIEAYGNYCKLHLIDTNKYLTVNYKISKLEQTLNQKQFIRVHRSYLINKKHITKMSSYQMTVNSSEIPIGESYKKDLLDVLKNY
jgi:two-component system LytT family response regulator